jgi:hypothetical protein
MSRACEMIEYTRYIFSDMEELLCLSKSCGRRSETHTRCAALTYPRETDFLRSTLYFLNDTVHLPLCKNLRWAEMAVAAFVTRL